MADPQGPKIIVDTDWKSQAQAEKERLAAAEKAKAPPARPASAGGPAAGPAPAGTGAPGALPDEHEMPKASFEELVRMLATQALLYLGAFPDPESGRRLVSLEMAQFNVDMLSMLEEKTRGNRTPEEDQFIMRMLAELQLQYVEISKAVQRAVEQGRVAPAGGPGVGGVASPGAGPALNINPRAKG